MKHLDILAGMIIVGLTTMFSPAVAVAEQQERTVDHTSTEKKEVSPTSAVTQPGTLPQGGGKESNKKPAAATTLLYKPPVGMGVPTGLIAGGSRGTTTCLSGDPRDKNTALTLSLLAPANHIGQTVHEQPSLYWYLSATAGCQVEITLTDEQTVEPLLELHLSPPIKPGVQRVQLADYGVRLTPGVQYQWAVALIPDPAHRSKDIIAASGIARIKATEVLQANLMQTDKTAAPALYAEAGLWYDAVAAISNLIGAEPQDPALRMQRAALLEQAQLPEVVE
jgi:hypothetical protein